MISDHIATDHQINIHESDIKGQINLYSRFFWKLVDMLLIIKNLDQ